MVHLVQSRSIPSVYMYHSYELVHTMNDWDNWDDPPIKVSPESCWTVSDFTGCPSLFYPLSNNFLSLFSLESPPDSIHLLTSVLEPPRDLMLAMWTRMVLLFLVFLFLLSVEVLHTYIHPYIR